MRRHSSNLTLGAAVFAIAAAGALFRVSFSGLDVLWAEDGRVFLQDAAVAMNPLVIFHPYAGSLHTLPRLVAEAALAFPAAWWAFAVSALSAIVAGTVALVVFLAAESLGLKPRTRIALAMITVFAPPLASEVLGTAVNLQTLLLWSAPWVFLAVPKSWWSAGLWAVFGLVLATTSIQALLFSPFLLWHWRDSKRWPLRGAVALGLGLQLYAAFHDNRQLFFGTPDIPSIFAGYILHAVAPAWTGLAGLVGSLVAHSSWWLVAAITLLPFVFASAVVVRRAGSRKWTALIVSFWVASLGIWAVGYVTGATVDLHFAAMTGEQLAASPLLVQGAVPAMLLLSILVLYTDPRFHGRRRWESRLQGELIVGLAIVSAAAIWVGSAGPRVLGPSWTTGVSAAEVACAEQLGTGTVQIPVAPRSQPGVIELPCSLLTPGEGR
jgi:hypothetical protein